jgi:hypothetical protein
MRSSAALRSSVRSSSQDSRASLSNESARSRDSITNQVVGKPPGWAYVDGIDEVYEMKKRLSRSLGSAGRGIRRVVLSEQRKEEQELERQRRRFDASMFEVQDDPWHKRDEALLEGLARANSTRTASMARHQRSISKQHSRPSLVPKQEQPQKETRHHTPHEQQLQPGQTEQHQFTEQQLPETHRAHSSMRRGMSEVTGTAPPSEFTKCRESTKPAAAAAAAAVATQAAAPETLAA